MLFRSYWGIAGWEPHQMYTPRWLFSVERFVFNDVSTTDRKLLCEALLRNWILASSSFPKTNYYRILETPWLAPLARADWVPPQQSASGVDFLANDVWGIAGAGGSTMQGYGIDKALQNEILDWAKLVWPLANWDSLRPQP